MLQIKKVNGLYHRMSAEVSNNRENSINHHCHHLGYLVSLLPDQ